MKAMGSPITMKVMDCPNKDFSYLVITLKAMGCLKQRF
jgi:hypothetical protein